MRYHFLVGSRSHHVLVEEHAAGPKFLVDGQAFEPTVRRISPGHYKVELAGKEYDFTIRNGAILLGAKPLDVEVRRARPELSRQRASGRKADGRVKPPMPGKVVEIKVKEGQAVTEGDVLIVLEAMKMQNDLKAPMNGTVKRIHIQDGANVEAGTVLLELEPLPAPAPAA